MRAHEKEARVPAGAVLIIKIAEACLEIQLKKASIVNEQKADLLRNPSY